MPAQQSLISHNERGLSKCFTRGASLKKVIDCLCRLLLFKTKTRKVGAIAAEDIPKALVYLIVKLTSVPNQANPAILP